MSTCLNFEALDGFYLNLVEGGDVKISLFFQLFPEDPYLISCY